MFLAKGFIPMALLIELNKQINELCLSNTLDNVVNPISKDIILKSDIYNKPAILILAVSLLRFQDAKNLLLSNPYLPNEINIQQGKTKRTTKINFSVIPKEIKHNIGLLTKTYEVFKYGTVRNNIRNYSHRYLNKHSLFFSNKAHLFRHLEASYRISKGCTPKEIMLLLGHVDFNAQNSYIHRELFS